VSHIDKIRALEGVFAEHEFIKREMAVLRQLVAAKTSNERYVLHCCNINTAWVTVTSKSPIGQAEASHLQASALIKFKPKADIHTRLMDVSRANTVLSRNIHQYPSLSYTLSIPEDSSHSDLLRKERLDRLQL
jgi:hypothetical protein